MFLIHIHLSLQMAVSALLNTINCCIWRQILIVIERETKWAFSDSLNKLYNNSVWSIIHSAPRRRKLSFLMTWRCKACALIRYTSNIARATTAELLSSLEIWRVVSVCFASCLFSEKWETCHCALWISSQCFKSDVKSLVRCIPHVHYWYHI